MTDSSPANKTFSSPDGTPGQRLAKGVAVTITGVVLLKGLRFLLLPLYTRFLSPEDYGILGVLMPLILFLSMVAGMGQDASINFFLFQEREEADRFRKTLSTVFCNYTVTSILLAFLVVVFSDLLFDFLSPEKAGIYASYRFIIVGLLLCHPAQQIVLVLLQAQEARIKIALINMGMFLLTFGLMLYQLIWKESGAYGQMLATFQANAFLAILFLAVFFTIIGKRFSYSIAAAKRTLAYGIPLVPHAVSLWALNLSDRFLLAKFRGLEETGYYTFAYTCGMAMQFVVTSMQQVWGPVFFDVSKNDPRAKEILGALATKWSLFLFIVAGAGILFAPELVRIIASKRYWVAIPFIIPVILGYLFNGLYTFPGLILQQIKKNAILSLCSITAASANVLSNLYFIPRYGPIAAAWNTAATFALMALLYYIVGLKLHPINIRWKQWVGGLFLTLGAVFLATLPLTATGEILKSLYALVLFYVFIRITGGFRRIFAMVVGS